MATDNQILDFKKIPYSWIRKEFELKREYRRGDKGRKVRIIQEWLSLQGPGIAIDGDFGSVTEKAVKQFQEHNDINPTGVIDQSTYKLLISPLIRAIKPLPVDEKSYSDLIIEYAQQHLVEHPREIGGDNCGPWVRLYMKGNHGSAWYWCAGFVCFILDQAARTLKKQMPIKGSFSCDTLAEQASNNGILISEKDIVSGKVQKADIPVGSLFLSRRTANDWVHTGIVTQFEKDTIETIEGNTNDEGSRNGYEVCKRMRGYRNKDFIRV